MTRAYLLNGFQIVRKISFVKVWNLALLRFSWLLSLVFHKPIVFGKPFSISIEPTAFCNLSCPECPSGLNQLTRGKTKASLELVDKVLDELKSTLIHVFFYFQGEPFLHPSILSMIKKASSLGIYTATSTNGHFINSDNAEDIVRSGLDKLIVSIDGITQEVYEQYRKGGKLDKVIAGVEALVAAKKKLNSHTPYIELQFLVTSANEHQIEQARGLCKKLGADHIAFKTAQLYDYVSGNPLMPINSAYSRYEKLSDGTYRIKNKLPNRCWRIWSSLVVCADGIVVPCCFDKDADFKVGDMSEGAIVSMWKGTLFNKFRSSVIHNRKDIEMCRNCSEGM